MPRTLQETMSFFVPLWGASGVKINVIPSLRAAHIFHTEVAYIAVVLLKENVGYYLICKCCLHKTATVPLE